MGNAFAIIRSKKTAKVMNINGETIKFKAPVYASEVLKDYPGLVLLESESVKHLGVRAKPLEPQQELLPKRLYFLVELPKLVDQEDQKAPRRVRSAGIHMSAKERLESLMLSRRTVSDLSFMKPTSIVVDESRDQRPENSGMRLKMRLPKAEVEKVMRESKDEAEAAARIMELCMANQGKNGANCASNDGDQHQLQEQVPWSNGNRGNIKKGLKSHEKRVGFMPITEGEIQLAVG